MKELTRLKNQSIPLNSQQIVRKSTILENIEDLKGLSSNFNWKTTITQCEDIVNFEDNGSKLEDDWSPEEVARIGNGLVDIQLKDILASKCSSFYVFLSKEATKDQEWCGFIQKRNSKLVAGVRKYCRRILCLDDGMKGAIPIEKFKKHFKPLILKHSDNMMNIMKLEAWLQNYTIFTLGLELPRVLHCVSGGGRTDKWVMGEKYVVGITYCMGGVASIKGIIINPEPTT